MPLQFSVIAQIHTRMPLILPEKDTPKWLGETEDGDLKALLKPFPADRMRIWEISPCSARASPSIRRPASVSVMR